MGTEVFPVFLRSELDEKYPLLVYKEPNTRDWVGRRVVAKFADGSVVIGICEDLRMTDFGAGEELQMILRNEDSYLTALWVEDVPALMIRKEE